MQLPMFGLVSFGLYSIMVICWSLATFPSCPEAASSLQLVRAGHTRADSPVIRKMPTNSTVDSARSRRSGSTPRHLTCAGELLSGVRELGTGVEELG